MVAIKFDNRNLPQIGLNVDCLMLEISLLLTDSFGGLLKESLIHPVVSINLEILSQVL